MIIKHLQHELFEEGDGNRLVYFATPFKEDAEHTARMSELEGKKDSPSGEDCASLSRAIENLKGYIKELEELLYVELSADAAPGTNRDIDDFAKAYGFGDDDADSSDDPDVVALTVAKAFADTAGVDIVPGNFTEQFEAYKKAFEEIQKIDLPTAISDWLPEGADGNPIDLSREIPEIGLWTFSDILADGKVTARAGDSADATISLYNEHGLQLQIPAGGTFEVRKNKPLRYYSDEVTASTGLGYLIPILYGGQELYIIVNDLELPELAIGAPTSTKEGSFEYTRPADDTKDITEQKFTLDTNLISGDDHNWHGVLALATEYEIAKEGDADAYMEKLYSIAMDKLDKPNPTIGDAATAIEYAHRRYYLDISGGKFGDTAYLQAKAYFIAAKLSTDPAGSADNLSLARTMMNTYDGLREDQKTRPDEMAQLEREVTAYEAAMEIERVLATEYFARDDDQSTADMLELYFDIESNGGANLAELLTEQLMREGGILAGRNVDLVKASIERLKDVVSALVTDQIEDRIDFNETTISGTFALGDTPAAKVIAQELFLKDSTVFDELDVEHDGVLIFLIEGKIYAIEKGVEADDGMRELAVSYVDKNDRQEHKASYKAPVGVLLAIAHNIDAGDSGHARDLQAGLVFVAGLPEMSLPEVRAVAATVEDSGDVRVNTADLIARLVAARPLTIPEGVTGTGEAVTAGETAMGDEAEGGEATAVAEEAGGGESAGDETTAETGESTTAEGEATATGGGEEPPEEPGSSEEGAGESGERDAEDEEPPIERDLLGRPKPSKIKPEMTDEVRRETVENNTVAMNKYRIEKLVYRGHVYKKGGENPPMVKVFAESRVKDLMDFYKQVEGMRYGGSDRRTHKGSWNAKFRGLLQARGVKVSDSGDIHLIGRPLILYNTIRRAIEEGNRNDITMDHGLTGDEWLDAMAAQQYLVSHKGESYVEGVPQVNPEHPDRMDSPGAILTDIYTMKEGDVHGYMVYVTSSGRDTPYVFKVKRTRTDYEIDYGDGHPAHFVNGEEVNKRFIEGILMDELGDGRKGTWTDFHAFRVDNVDALIPAKLEEYHREFMENITLEESRARVERAMGPILREISKDSKLPLPLLKKLLGMEHSKLLDKVAAIYIRGIKTGPGEATLDKFEYAAAKLYLEKIGYRFGPKKSGGGKGYIPTDDVPKEDSDPAIDNLRDMVGEAIEAEGTADADDIIPEEEEAGHIAGKETGRHTPPHRASVMEKLAALGVPPTLALRAKRIHRKFVDHLWANSGEITIRRMDYIRFGFPAKEYKARMGNRLAIAEFGNMIGKIEGGQTRGGGRTQGLRAAILYQIDTRNLPLFTSNNTVDDVLLRMAAITALAETQELSCSVAYVLGDSDRAGPRIADRGEGYASPRLRKSVYRRYT